MTHQTKEDYILHLQGLIIRKQKEILKNWQKYDCLKMQRCEAYIKAKQRLIRFAKSGKMQFGSIENPVKTPLNS